METEKKATVQGYLDAQKKDQNRVETLGLRIRQAYDKALEGTIEGNYVRLEKLVNDTAREKFKGTLVSELTKPLQKAMEALPEDPLEAEKLTMNLFYGFTREQLAGLVDAVKGNLTYEALTQLLAEKTNYQTAIETRAQASVSLLDKIPTEDVLRYTGVEVKDPSRLTWKDKADLIAQKERSKLLESRLNL